MANYNVQITNGTGSANMLNSQYSVTVNANGYESTTLSPDSYTVSGSAGTGNFTVSADGVLTIIFNETGAAGGTPITSGSVIMTNKSGTIYYGQARSINANGKAVFNNVPYSANSPYTLYFKQLSSDYHHNPINRVITVHMSRAAQKVYVLNTAAEELQKFTLTDANYEGLPVNSANLNFTGE